MRTSTIKIILFLLFIGLARAALSFDTLIEEKACNEIGFTKRNPDFGECVLELIQRRKVASSKNISNPTQLTNYKSSPARQDGGVWNLRQIAGTNNPATYLLRPDQTVYETIKINDARLVVNVADSIGNSANIRPTLFLKESSEINAGATFDKDGKPIIIINKPMMDLIKNDPDMAAALLGHETAHLYLHHPGATATTDTVGSILGLLAGVALEVVAQRKLGVTNLGIQGGDLIGTAFSTSFTRDQERDADRQGMIWAKQNGYDPMGAVRLFQVLENKNGNNLIPFFQSHPNPSERIENARQRAMSL
jgi:predicted Zn-dependent protease